MIDSGLSRRQILQSGAAVLLLQAARPRGSVLYGASGADSAVCLAAAKAGYPPPLEKFMAKLDPAADDFLTERYAAEIAKLLKAWSSALCKSSNNLEAVADGLSSDISGRVGDPSEVKALRSSGALRMERRTFEGPVISGRDALVKSLGIYLSDFSALETVELEIYGIRVAADSPLTVETELRCDLVGTAKDGHREQRVGAWLMSWIQESPGEWKALRWTMQPELRSRLEGPGFTDITGRCIDTAGHGAHQLGRGIDYWRTALDGACGIDVYGNHGVAVGDIDGGGFDSFYVCQPSGLPNRLYRNRGDGTFEDITDQSGAGILDGTASALFVDFQNRGKQDLLVVRSAGPLLFANRGDGRFEPRPDAFRFEHPPEGTFTSAAAVDYDRDGFVDVYFCVYSYYQGLNQYQFPAPYYDAKNGPPNFLFRNRGDGTFQDVTAASGMDRNNDRFSFAAAWCDYDNDGWPDLYVANDFGRKNFYRNNGDGTFTDVADRTGVEDYGPGMSVCWLDYDNDGRQDVYVANMWLMEGKRITGGDQFLPGVSADVRALYRKHNAGNSLYRNRGSERFEDKSTEAGSAMGRWSWSCAAWDFDHDGWPDLYVANGFVSGPNHFDLQSFFWRQVARRSLAPPGASQDYEAAWNAINELIRADYSWSGYERNVFFANNGDGTFSDVSGVLGLDFRDDSRAFALSDFDHDGRMEFVLKNRTRPQLRILRNDMEKLGNRVSFRLRGKVSNRDAIGATVTVEAGAKHQTQFVSAGSGFASQHTKDLFFGMGDTSERIDVSVRWPTGKIDRFEGVPMNHRIDIEEDSKEFRSSSYRVANARRSSPEPLVVPENPELVNTWLIAPLFGPDIGLTDASGATRLLSSFRGKPALLSFLRSDCADGVKQVDLIARGLKSATEAGLAIIPVPTDKAPEAAIGAWNILWRYLFDRRRDMPVPTSFLLNGEGAILRVYQGAIDPLDVVKDWKAAQPSPAAQFARAIPFAGPYYGNPMTHNYFTDGIAFAEYGYEDAAKEAFERVVKGDPNHAGAWFNLGTIYLGKKMLADARRCLEISVRLNPRDSDAWNNLGMISGEEQNYEQALDYFRKASRANPNHLLAVQNMIRILQYQGRAAEAQSILEELIARAPENSDLHLGLGMALVAQKQLDRAREELETAVRLRPGNLDALNDLGALLLRVGRAPEALERFAECRRLAPDFDRPFLNTAIAFKSMGQFARAQEVLSEFLARHPENADVRSALEKLGSK